jgi:gamma-glutamylcysteine synthetase
MTIVLPWSVELLREEIVAAESATREQERRASAAGVSPADFGGHKIPNVLEFTQHLLEQYLDLKPHEYVALSRGVDRSPQRRSTCDRRIFR